MWIYITIPSFSVHAEFHFTSPQPNSVCSSYAYLNTFTMNYRNPFRNRIMLSIDSLSFSIRCVELRRQCLIKETFRISNRFQINFNLGIWMLLLLYYISSGYMWWIKKKERKKERSCYSSNILSIFVTAIVDTKILS